MRFEITAVSKKMINPAFKIVVRLMLSLILVLLSVSCSRTASNQPEIAEQTRVITQSSNTEIRNPEKRSSVPLEKIDVTAYNYYVNGLIFTDLGDMNNAAESFRQAWTLHNDSYEIGLAYAQALIQLRRVDDALGALSKIPNPDAEIYLLSANCYRMKGDDLNARKAYFNTIKVDPKNVMAYSFLAGFYRNEGLLDSTLWAFENIARLVPDNFRIWNDLAAIALQKGDIERAKSAYLKSLDVNAGITNTAVYFSLGKIHQVSGKVDSAVTLFQKGLQLEPDNVQFMSELIPIYVSQDSLTLALTYARKITQIAPSDRVASRRLAALYVAVDSLDRADSLFSELISNGDKATVNYYYLGRIAILREDYEAALPNLEQVAAMADTIPESWTDLAFVHRQLGRIDKEIETYKFGLNRMRAESSAVILSLALGAAYERSGRIEDAVVTFEEILTHSPDHAQTLNYLGYMLADRGKRLDYARDLIARAVELNPKNAAFLDSYGWVYYRLGDYEKAVMYLAKAIEQSSDPVIFDHLGDAYAAMGKKQEAKQSWEKALTLQPTNTKIKEKLEH
ncbi:MAG: tetratricopeptide repeat protein [candidate division Zixibacteria bacterium]|nr:tetratricopeptide repeat protein [candidate division Zixibacteria bacterium]